MFFFKLSLTGSVTNRVGFDEKLSEEVNEQIGRRWLESGSAWRLAGADTMRGHNIGGGVSGPDPAGL